VSEANAGMHFNGASQYFYPFILNSFYSNHKSIYTKTNRIDNQNFSSILPHMSPDARISPAPHAEMSRYTPSRDVTKVATHLTELLEKPKDTLTDIDCLQAIADVATLYGATEPNGWTSAVLKVNDRNLYADVSYNGWRNQGLIGSVEIYKKIQEPGRKTYRAEQIYSYLCVLDNGKRIFYKHDNLQNTQPTASEITAKDRSKVIQDLSRAFTKRVQDRSEA
jgi:hypothetical protein